MIAELVEIFVKMGGKSGSKTQAKTTH